MGLIPSPGEYPVDFSVIDQGYRSAIQSPSVELPSSQEITSTTLFSTPQEFTTGAEIGFATETTNSTSETTFVVITQKAILRLMTLAAVQFSGQWVGIATCRWRISRNGVDVLNIVRYMPARDTSAVEGFIIGETFPLNNFVVLPGDTLYIRYSRNVVAASTSFHCHLHGTLLPT